MRYWWWAVWMKLWLHQLCPERFSREFFCMMLTLSKGLFVIIFSTTKFVPGLSSQKRGCFHKVLSFSVLFSHLLWVFYYDHCVAVANWWTTYRNVIIISVFMVLNALVPNYHVQQDLYVGKVLQFILKFVNKKFL